MMRSWWWIVVAGLVIGGCKKHGELRDSREVMVEALQDPARRGPAFAKSPQGSVAESTAPGPALFYLKDVGVVKFDVDGTVTRIPANDHSADALGLDRDGAILVGGIAGVFRLKDGKSEKLGGDASNGPGNASAFLVAPDGAIWVSATDAVFKWDGRAWTKFSVDDSNRTYTALAMDAKGRIYTASDKVIGVIDGGTWQQMYDVGGAPHEGEIEQPSIFQLFVVNDKLVAVHRYGFIVLDGKGVQAIERKPMDATFGHGRIRGTDFVTVTSDHVHAGVYVLQTPVTGGPDKVIDYGKGLSNAYEIQIDAAGRVWTPGSLGGLLVVGPDGKATRWEPGTLEALSGTIGNIYIAGSGPTTLPAVGKVVKGTIVGLVTKAGKPLANDYVEVCKFPDSRFDKGSTPCASRDVHGSSHTDAGGRFSIADLPLNDYTVVIKDGDTWYSLLGSTCAGMKSGERCDVGELDISKTIDLPH